MEHNTQQEVELWENDYIADIAIEVPVYSETVNEHGSYDILCYRKEYVG